MEIERKFLVKGDFRQEAYASSHIVQGYLSVNRLNSVRVRIRDDKGYITVKGKSTNGGLSRFEWEKEISAQEALDLLTLAEPGTIDKTRHLVKNTDGVHTWEVDEFHGANEGLTMAEIELSSEDDTFDKPEWLGEEVTGDPRYYNSSLRINPYRNGEAG
ncbi:MAG: CYTH domain-containing protein [Bacteroidales bacterium]|nr:CYTH domain-containing protein [Bacteroidales bacterium]